MTAAHVGEKVCHPVDIIKVNGVKCHALLDAGATGSYISAFLVNLLKVKPSHTLTRGIKTIMGLVTKRVETYDDARGVRATSLRDENRTARATNPRES